MFMALVKAMTAVKDICGNKCIPKKLRENQSATSVMLSHVHFHVQETGLFLNLFLLKLV